MDSGNKPDLYGNDHDSSVHEETAAIRLTKRSKSPMFHSRVTGFDRWLARAMMDVVGNPECTLRLWDGADVSAPVDDPVAVILYGNRQ